MPPFSFITLFSRAMPGVSYLVLSMKKMILLVAIAFPMLASAQIDYIDVNDTFTMEHVGMYSVNSPDTAYRNWEIHNIGDKAVSNMYPFESEYIVITLDKTINCKSSRTSQVFRTNKVVHMPVFIYSNSVNFDRGGYTWGNQRIMEAYKKGQQLSISKVAMADRMYDTRAFITGEGHSQKRCLINLEHVEFVGGNQSDSNSTGSWINNVIVSEGQSPTTPVSTTWDFTVDTAGTYQVYAHWVSNQNTVANASFSFNGEAPTDFGLDQSISSGVWVKVGASKAFTAGNHSVELSVDPTAFYVVDGIKVELVQ